MKDVTFFFSWYNTKMNSLMSVKELLTLSYSTYKNNFKKLKDILFIFFIVSVVPALLIDVLSQMSINGGFDSFETNPNSGIYLILLFVFVVIFYIASIVLSLIITAGFFRRLPDLETASFKPKEVVRDGAKLFWPTILLLMHVHISYLGGALIIALPVLTLIVLLGFILAGTAGLPIILGIAAFLTLIVAIIPIIYFTWAYTALYIDDKKGLDALRYSFNLMKHNVLSVIFRFAALFIPVLLGYMILGFIFEGLIHLVLGGVSESNIGLIAISGILFGGIQAFIVAPLVMIFMYIMYRNLVDIYEAKDEKETDTGRDYVKISFKTGLIAITFIVLALVTSTLLGFSSL